MNLTALLTLLEDMNANIENIRELLKKQSTEVIPALQKLGETPVNVTTTTTGC